MHVCMYACMHVGRYVHFMFPCSRCSRDLMRLVFPCGLCPNLGAQQRRCWSHHGVLNTQPFKQELVCKIGATTKIQSCLRGAWNLGVCTSQRWHCVWYGRLRELFIEYTMHFQFRSVRKLFPAAHHDASACARHLWDSIGWRLPKLQDEKVLKDNH